jgi:nucleotide-binding universal stress UspA family protein
MPVAGLFTANRPAGRDLGLRTSLVPANTAQPLPVDAVELAARLASERREPSIELLAFTGIPLGEDMDVALDELEDAVPTLTAEARAIAGRYGVTVHTRHVRTRDPADAVLGAAARTTVQAIVLGARGLAAAAHRRTTDDLAVRQVLERAEQRVYLVHGT